MIGYLSLGESGLGGKCLEQLQPSHKPLASSGRKCPARREVLMPLLPVEQEKTGICMELREPGASQPQRHIFPTAVLLTAEGP